MALNTLIVIAEETADTKETSFKIKGGFNNASREDMNVEWSYWPATNAKEKKIIGASTIRAGKSAILYKTVKGLLPNTVYTVKIRYVNGTQMAAACNITTKMMTRTFACDERTASTLRVSVSGLKKYPYDRQIKFSIKRADATEWEAKRVEDVPKGSNDTVTYLFTGLKQSTAYKLKMEAYKVEGGKSTRIAWSTLNKSTKAYSPTDKPIPYFTNKIIVPVPTGRALLSAFGILQCGVDGDLGTDYKVHLYSSADNVTFTDEGAWGDITKPKLITGTGNVDAYYKLAVVKSGVAYNTTDSIKVGFPVLTFANKTQGTDFDVTNEFMEEICDALVKSFQYRHYTRTGLWTGIYTLDNPYYIKVLGLLGEISDDTPVEGGLNSILQIIFDLLGVMNTETAVTVGAKGTPITASLFNTLMVKVATALDE